MFEELECPGLDAITGKWFVPLETQNGYLSIACTIIHDGELRRENLNQVYFHTEHAAHAAAAAYYLNKPNDSTYPYSKEWDICIAELGDEIAKIQSEDKESTSMEFI